MNKRIACALLCFSGISLAADDVPAWLKELTSVTLPQYDRKVNNVVRLTRFMVTPPAGWELKSASFNGAPKESGPSGGTYTWQMENLAAIEREDASPSLLTLAPWTGVNVLGRQRIALSWPELAKQLT